MTTPNRSSQWRLKRQMSSCRRTLGLLAAAPGVCRCTVSNERKRSMSDSPPLTFLNHKPQRAQLCVRETDKRHRLYIWSTYRKNICSSCNRSLNITRLKRRFFFTRQNWVLLLSSTAGILEKWLKINIYLALNQSCDLWKPFRQISQTLIRLIKAGVSIKDIIRFTAAIFLH